MVDDLKKKSSADNDVSYLVVEFKIKNVKTVATEVTWCYVNEKELASKWVPTPFFCQTKKKLAEEKLQIMAQDTKIQTVTWVAYDPISALLPIRMTTFSKTNWKKKRKI